MKNIENNKNMKKILLALSLFSSAAMAQDYESMWREYERYEKDNRPASAIEVLDRIYDSAFVQRDFQTMLKSYLLKVDNESKIGLERNRKEDEIKRLEAMMDMDFSDRDKSLLSSLLFAFYCDFYEGNEYRFGKLTPVESGDLPENMDGWSREDVLDHMMKYLLLVKENIPALVMTSTGDYDLIFEQNELGEYVGHNAASVVLKLVKEKIEGIADGLANYYQQTIFDVGQDSGESFLSCDIDPSGKYDFTAGLLSLYKLVESEFLERDMKDAFVVTEADRIDFFRTMSIREGAYGRLYSDENGDDAVSVEDSVAIAEYDRLIDNYSEQTKTVPYAIYRKVLTMKENIQLRGKALDVIRKACVDYPRSSWKDALKAVGDMITEPYLSVRTETVCPGESINLYIESRNIASCRVRLYKARKGLEYVDYDGTDNEVFLRKNAELYSNRDYRLDRFSEWEINSDTLSIDGLPQGRWYISITSPGKKVERTALITMDITEYTFITAVVDGRNELLVLDSRSGRPQEGVNVELSEKYKFEAKDTVLVTDSRGVVCVPDKYRSAQVYSDGEYKTRFNYITFYENAVRDTDRYVYRLFTDRSVYRPGQKVRVSGFVAKSAGEAVYGAAAGRSVDVRLKGSYGLNLEMNSVEKTDVFGTFAADFQLPQHCANGEYYIEAGNERLYIRVEEYKRPTYEVSLDKPSVNFSIGDTVSVKGNALLLSGAALQDADVKYKIERGTSRWSFWWFGNYAMIGEGSLKTDAEGNFSIPVSLEPVKGKAIDGFYSFRVTVAVTSLAGETREETVTLYAGDRSYLVSCYMPDIAERDNGLRFMPAVTNLGNKPVDAEGTFVLLEADSKKEVLRGRFASNKEVVIPSDSLYSGKFVLRIDVDDRGRTTSVEKSVVLFSESDTSVPVDSHLWCYQLNREISGEQPAEFMLGTSSDKAYFIMYLTDGNRTVGRRDIVLGREMRKISVPLSDKNDKGLGIHIVSCKDGKFYDNAFTYKVREPEHELTMKWQVFRDRLHPGEAEEWRLKFYNPDGTPARANVAAYMYDSSLDMIYENPVNYLLDYSRIVYLTYINTVRSGWWTQNVYFRTDNKPYRLPEPDKFHDFIMGSTYMFNFVEPRLMQSKSMAMADNAVLEECAVMGTAVPEVAGGEKETVQIRENFAETAFFYPRLRTDENGEVAISFTLPESMTRWHFYALAHTENMYQIQADTMVVASKELMIMPEIPRFVRTGDKASIAASVVNCTGKEMSGKVRFELFDPVTDKVIERKEHNFETRGNETAKVLFGFDVTDEYGTLGVRMVAETSSFSDGEQSTVPVLSDKVHVTESVHFSVNGGETVKCDITGLFNGKDRSVSGRTLTVDVTESPVWYAVEALPVISDSNGDNAVSDAAALYANLMVSHMLVTTPGLQTLAKAWAEAAAKSDAPLSMLERNQDLKNILLAETPWMLEAKNDSERIRRLANLFDVNNMNYLTDRYLVKISSLQNSDGSISWFAGGKGSYYVTAYVAEKLLALKSAGVVLPEKAGVIMVKAVGYMNTYMSKEYKRIVRPGNGGLNAVFLDFAYMKALYGMELTENGKYVYDYVVSRLSDNLKSMSLVSLAKAVVILKDAGKEEEAQRFFTSLNEFGVTDDNCLYFPSQTNYYGWGEYPVTSHVAIMQAYKYMDAGVEKMDALRTWLIQQKRTQDWGNVVATVDAVAELLDCGTDWISNKGNVEIRIGRRNVDFEQGESDITGAEGSKRKVYEEKDIPGRLNTVTVSNNGKSPSWGAVYAQYDIPYSAVKENGSGMAISKQTYIRRTVDGREVLLDPASVDVRVGDEYVSLIKFSLERDMDFVHIRDRRASCAEPGISLSGYRLCGDVWTYVQQRDSSTDYFFDSLAAGEYTLQAVYRIDRAGEYTTGNAEIQCLYAPEFNAHSDSSFIRVVD